VPAGVAGCEVSLEVWNGVSLWSTFQASFDKQKAFLSVATSGRTCAAANAQGTAYQDSKISFQYPASLQKKDCGPQIGKQTSRFLSCVELFDARTGEVLQVRYGEFIPGRDQINDIADGLVFDYILDRYRDWTISFTKLYEDPLMQPPSCPLGPLQHRLYGGGSYNHYFGERVLGSTVIVGGRVVNVLDAWNESRGRSEARPMILSSLKLR
jgi:hypothetical protein